MPLHQGLLRHAAEEPSHCTSAGEVGSHEAVDLARRSGCDGLRP